MNDPHNTQSNHIEELTGKIRAFVDEREWSQFHSPKNLSMALAVEASELMEIFQWLTEEQSHQLDPKMKQRVEEEMGDVMNYLIRLADQLDIDLIKAVENKLIINQQKYPADLVRGQSKKYSEYQK